VATKAEFDGLFIATPERVSFSYQLAGLGSRIVAQMLDVLILSVVLFVILLATTALSSAGPSAGLVFVIASFLLLNGYFIFFEGLWSGQTPGKKAARLRAVGDAGQPITFEQALMRNLVRNLDFLPALYGVGLVALFANGRGKRLGDMAAGTVVVRERSGLPLARLVAMAETSLATAAQRAASPGPTGVPDTAAYVRERALRDLDPPLRDFVIAYAGRRRALAQPYKVTLAESARAALARALPAVVVEQGPLAALDQLADYASGPVGVPPPRAADPGATGLPPPRPQ
jgi:uncharacterized RDD family membrane protein YckC